MRGQLKDASFITQIMVLIMLCIFFGVIFSLLGAFTATWVFPNANLSFAQLSSGGFKDVPSLVLQWVQLFSATGLFVLPPLFLAALISEPDEDFLAVSKPLPLTTLFLSVVIVLAFLPVVDVLTNAMYALPFPESLAYLKERLLANDAANGELVGAMLSGDSIYKLLMNLLVIAVVPAIGEELLFRGTVQPLLIRWIKRPFLAIVITSLFFAVMHQQFFTFPGLFFISIILGYLRHWTGNLKAAMVTHFVNNGLVVVVIWFTGMQPNDPLPVENSYLWSIAGVLLTAGILFTIYKTHHRN